ncbi:Zinc finger protein 706 [Podarcis lilfordi]|uniref:Zinc finger protein 706 n=1 Tax=Podarcis lilfordi TaxID=74358 RepID=A0AA35PBG5_9SAUR|nr:Zinc finger protein 706 [Podarcis lilfordi]
MRRWRERPGLAWPDSRLSAAAGRGGACALRRRRRRRTGRETDGERDSVPHTHTHGLLHPHGQAAAAAAAGPRGAFRSCRRTPGRRDLHSPDMARGQQKIQSQQKNAKKQAGAKKKQGHDQKAAAKAALIYTCTVCRTQMPDPKTFKQHFESKHPKTPLPPELADVQA